MSGIQNIFGINPKASQVKNSDRVRNEKAPNKPAEKAKNGKKEVQDVASISSEARELLNLKKEAKDYVSQVKESKTLSDTEIEQLKKKIEEGYSKDPAIIDSIVEKLLKLPNFFE